jgi:Cytochrome P460
VNNGTVAHLIMDLFTEPISLYNGAMRFVITGAVAAYLLFTLSAAPSVHADDVSVSFPDGYRAWTFLHASVVPAGFGAFSKSPCVKPCSNGIFYFYANELAMQGLRTGTYADGAIIAEEMLELRISDKGNGGEGQRVLTAVMVKDNSRYAATGGWGFGHFDEGSKTNALDAKAQQVCYQCHTFRKDHGFVFTQYVER